MSNSYRKSTYYWETLLLCLVVEKVLSFPKESLLFNQNFLVVLYMEAYVILE